MIALKNTQNSQKRHNNESRSTNRYFLVCVCDVEGIIICNPFYDICFDFSFYEQSKSNGQRSKQLPTKQIVYAKTFDRLFLRNVGAGGPLSNVIFFVLQSRYYSIYYYYYYYFSPFIACRVIQASKVFKKLFIQIFPLRNQRSSVCFFFFFFFSYSSQRDRFWLRFFLYVIAVGWNGSKRKPSMFNLSLTYCHRRLTN